MDKHTDGPWRAEYTNGAKLTYVVVSAIQGSNGSTVVIGQCGGPDKEANARLISAAPDLLWALKALDERGHTQATWEIAKRAIAKAEGRDTPSTTGKGSTDE